MKSIVEYFVQLPLFELVAVFLSLLYVVLAAKDNLWCWPAAFISTVIYTIIFYDVALFMDSILNVYYMVMAVYGWYSWQKNVNKESKINQDNSQDELVISTWRWQTHLFIIIVLTLLTLVVGYFIANYTTDPFPYLDTATTLFAVFTTYLVTKKILENWLYWIVIDFVSIYLYLAKSLQPTAALFAIYVVISIYGYLQWLSIYREQRHESLQELADGLE